MNICLVNDDLKLGGKEKIICDLAINYSKQNHNVLVLLLGSDKTIANCFLNKKVKVLFLNYELSFSYKFKDLLKISYLNKTFTKEYHSFFEALNQFKPDLIHTHFSYFGWKLTRLYSQKKDVKTIVTIHGNFLPKTSEVNILKKTLIKQLIKHNLKDFNLSFVSKELIKDFTYLKRNTNKYRVIENGIDFNNKLTSKSNKNGLNIIYIASFTPNKNHENLLKAISLLNGKIKIRLTLIGDGMEMERMKNLCTLLKINEIITFTGVVFDVNKYLVNANCAIFPSYSEGLSRAILEKISAGLPLIASDIKSHRNFLDDESVLFFNPNSPKEIAEKIILLNNNYQQALEKATNTFKMFKKSYSSENMALKYLEFYNNV